MSEHARDVPAVATLPGVGPYGAFATAPTGRGLEAAIRSWAGGTLGTAGGAAAGGLLGTGLGAGLGTAYGAGLGAVANAAFEAAHGHPPADVFDTDALMDAGALGGAGVGALLGTTLGGLEGSVHGSRAALKPIYAAPARRATLASADPYDIELLKLADAAMRIP